uniref:Nudix hydrolase domain-containing protein n=1 Tax=Mycena chlorophos TaxID=658473 RepID=A0ABQ0KXB7_MYCCL|nr:predicted protein [Mycena chlorophos]
MSALSKNDTLFPDQNSKDLRLTMQLDVDQLAPLSRSVVERLTAHEWHPPDLSAFPRKRLAAVLVLLYEQDGQLRVLLTTRSKALRTHAGQTAFPGGRYDETDLDLVQTAFREAHEEVALPLDSPHIHVLAIAPPFISLHKLVVTPILAYLTDPDLIASLKPSPDEVAAIFTHPLEAILDPELAAKENLVERGEDWIYETELHNTSVSEVALLNNAMYRMHRFRSVASPIKGLTADILIQVAEVAFGRKPQYERWAEGQPRGPRPSPVAPSSKGFKLNLPLPMSVLLPQELLQAIFDRVDDISTLKAGALAGPRLADPCQRNIFRKLRVFAESEAWRPSLQAAAAFFSTHQHLCAHVRDLTIHLSTTHSDSAALRYLLGAFQPERLVISGRSVLWSSLASDVSQGLITCFACPALRRLHLRHLASIPRDVLAVALSVPVVALTYASGVPHEPSPLTTIGVVPQRPRRLILTESDLKEYRFLLEGGLLSGVDHLELELDKQYPETCSSPDKLLLSACAESLTQVVLGLGYLSHPISIPTLPHVHSAVIQVGLDALWVPDPPPFPMTLTNIVGELPGLKKPRPAFHNQLGET